MFGRFCVFIALTIRGLTPIVLNHTGATNTSVVTNEWALAEIIRNPKIQRKIQEEINSVVGVDHNVEESDLSKLPYLMCVIKETFWLHPVGPFSIPKETMTDTKLAGYQIPKGTRVLINIFSLGRSAETWSEPLKFRGSRSPNFFRLKLLAVANIVRQVLQIERHFDLGRGL